MTLEGMEELIHHWQLLLVEKPVIYSIIIALSYIVIMLLPLPVTAITTVSSGYIFGFWIGALVLSLTSLLSAIILFLLSKHLVRDFISTRFSKYTNTIDAEIEEAGVWYALSLRLFPVVPFFILNCLQGITPLKLKDFIISTFFGMLPVSLVLVNTGSQLAYIEKAEDLLSAKIMLSLFLIALVPLCMRLTRAYITSKAKKA